jgi:integrase
MLKKVIDHIDIELISSISRDVIIKKIKDFLPKRTTKDLRHTFITRCRECKIQREITSVWSGHVSDNSMTTKVYTHLAQNKELQLEEIALFNYDL